MRRSSALISTTVLLAAIGCGEDPPAGTPGPAVSAGTGGTTAPASGPGASGGTNGTGGAGASGGSTGDGGSGAASRFCGDGIVQAGESCDDGNQANDDSCPDDVLNGGTCQAATCGDGHVWSTDGGAETCDDGNGVDDDACPDGALGQCVAPTCDDGVWRKSGVDAEAETDCGGSCGPCFRSLLMSEIVTGPTGAEFIEIYNPSAVDVPLDDVYLADYADYYLVTQSLGPPTTTDFRVRFPPGAMLLAGDRVVVATSSATAFQSAYGTMPDYDFDDADAGAPAMLGEIDALSRLSSTEEMLVLFRWDGTSELVTDIDYLVWGDTADAMDKSNITVGASTYAAETAAAAQTAASTPPSNRALARCLYGEGSETGSGANGFGGADETSEPFATTWSEVDPTPGAPNGCPVFAAVQPGVAAITYLDRATFSEVDSVAIRSDQFDIVGAVAIAQDPSTGAVYAVLKDTNTLRRFARINVATGVANVIGQPLQALSALAYDPAGTLYAMTGDGAPLREDLVTVDPSTVALTTVLGLQTGACCGEAMTFNPSDGLFYRFSGFIAPIMQSVDASAPSVLDVTMAGPMPQEVTGAFWDQDAGHFVAFDNALSVLTVTPDGTVTDTGMTLTSKIRGGLIP